MKKILIFLSVLIFGLVPVYATGTDALLFYNKGIDCYKIGLYEEAIANFKKSIESDSEFVDAYYNLGSVYEFLQQYDEALMVFKQAIVRNPEDYDAIYHAAWISYKQGDINKAKTFLSLIPSDCEKSNDARNLYSMMGVTPTFRTEEKPVENKSKPNDIFDNLTSPTGLAVDDDGNLYVAQFGANSITKITPDGKKILFVKNSKINGPIGIDFDNFGNLYVANYNDNNVLKVSPGGGISVLITNISKPYGLIVKNGTLYVSLQGSSSVLKYKLK